MSGLERVLWSKLHCMFVVLSGILKHSPVCSICIDNFEDNDKLITLPCGHCFHAECIKSWLQLEVFCPNCRYPLVRRQQDGQGDTNRTTPNANGIATVTTPGQVVGSSSENSLNTPGTLPVIMS